VSPTQELVERLAGTAGALELSRAQDHLRQQYDATRPLFDMLLQAYPQFLQPQWFDYDGYLWAAELWYRRVAAAVACDYPASLCLF
jgi:hypothetical protein